MGFYSLMFRLKPRRGMYLATGKLLKLVLMEGRAFLDEGKNRTEEQCYIALRCRPSNTTLQSGLPPGALHPFLISNF
jgi:hypothetical protein